MRVVIALGGNALLKRGEPMTAEKQRGNVRSVAPALAAVASKHELVLSHGNGPQVGLLALQAAAYAEVEPYPLDVLGAQSEGMIGYVMEQELGNVLPQEVPPPPSSPWWRSIRGIQRSEIPRSLSDPFTPRSRPPGWPPREAGHSARTGVLAASGSVAAATAHLRDSANSLAVRAGCHRYLRRRRGCSDDVHPGKPSDADRCRGRHRQGSREPASRPRGRSRSISDGNRRPWCLRGRGMPEQRQLGRVTSAELRAMRFAAGSIGPKVEAAASFVEGTQKRAAIGALAEIEAIVAGRAGTQVLG